MPRFDDGAIDMQELLRRLAEQVVNAVMDAEADQLSGGGTNSRNGYREHADIAHPEALHRHEHPQGAEGSREDGSVQTLQGPGERHRVEPGRRRRGARHKAPRRHNGTLRLARRQNRGAIGYQQCSRFQDVGPTRFGSGSTPTFSTLPNFCLYTCVNSTKASI